MAQPDIVRLDLQNLANAPLWDHDTNSTNGFIVQKPCLLKTQSKTHHVFLIVNLLFESPWNKNECEQKLFKTEYILVLTEMQNQRLRESDDKG